MSVGDRVSLINEGSTFTDAGSLVPLGEYGVVIGHKGFDTIIVHWLTLGIPGEARPVDVKVINRLPRG